VVIPPIRLLAVDIDGTLLNPQFEISTKDRAALLRAHQCGVEVVLATGRRHRFALPIAQQLGFDHWLISSNGAITRSLSGETFHRDMLPAETCRKLCVAMQEFRGNTVLTFDVEGKGAVVLEHMNELNGSIKRWLEKNLEFIDFVVPIEDSLTSDPIQAMFCGGVARMSQALNALASDGLPKTSRFCEPNIPAAIYLSWTCSIQSVPRATPSNAGPTIAVSPANRSWPLVITITTLRCLPSPVCPLSWGMRPRNCAAEVGR